MTTRRPVVIGYGNGLRGDDAVGPLAAEAMAADVRFAGVTVLSVHQLTPELADDVAVATMLVVVDAIVDGASPGMVRTARIDTENGGTPFTHHVSAGTILGLAQLLHGYAPAGTAVTVSVADLDGDGGLTPAVAAAVPQVVELVAGLVLGHVGA